jgi:tetratricopeptide (TPR) repeat protein
LYALVAVGTLATAAQAEDQPTIAPPAGWVKPLAVPADDGKHTELPIKILLLDQQVAFEPGRTQSYMDMAMKIQAPAGLRAGNISLPWRPQLDRLVVHKLLVHRGAKTIDVLAEGQAFTVLRRETNLEMAMLDGVLTANIQPEGLEVGDVLEMAFTLESTDPTLQGHVELLAADWDDMPIARAHLHAQWPDDVAMRLKPLGLEPPKPVKKNGLASVDLSLSDIEPVQAPKGAPLRFRFGRQLEFSDFAGWAELSALMAPLYDKASHISAQGKLADEVEKIRAASADPKARAEAALALVQNRIRYVALEMGVGGFVPADAETTWSRRYGDCKGKTALLLAVLHALDIAAEPVLVNSRAGDGLDKHLPRAGMFDHVLVRAHVGERDYWLDGTRMGDTALERIRIPAFHWGLAVLPVGGGLVPMMPAPYAQPQTLTTIRIDATAGITEPAPFHAERLMRGDHALATSLLLKNLTADKKEQFLREFWRDRFDFVDIKSVETRHDEESGEMTFLVDGTAHMEWPDGWYETNLTSLAFRADFTREPGPDSDAPFEVDYPSFSETRETILLPKGFGQWKGRDSDNVDRTIAGVEYHRTAKMDGDVFTVVRSERSIAPEFPFKEAAAAQTALRELADNDVYLRRPASLADTHQDLEAVANADAKSAPELIRKGSALLDLGRLEDAIAAFDKALAIEPKSAFALADRGVAHVWQQEEELAVKDFDAAETLDPHNAIVSRGRGLLLAQKGECRQAIAAFTRSLEVEPDNAFALDQRASCYWTLHDAEHALADSAAAIEQEPQSVNAYLLRANIFRSQGKIDEAAAVADALAAANPKSDYALVGAANIYGALHRNDKAMQAYDQALAVHPAAYIYINRSMFRPREARAERLADLDAALKLEPDNLEALGRRAALLDAGGDHAGAIAAYSAALELHQGDVELLLGRAAALAHQGKTELAARDFSIVRAKADTASALNEVCWGKATAGVALESALADCEAALAKSPDSAAIEDSRAFVLLRLNRLEEAIASYDRALARAPQQTASLYGRAIAYARKGDGAKARQDAAAALKLSPDIATRFEGYGLKR